MTSLILGVVCIYLAYTILKMPEDAFRQELDQITGRDHTLRYYRFVRGGPAYHLSDARRLEQSAPGNQRGAVRSVADRDRKCLCLIGAV